MASADQNKTVVKNEIAGSVKQTKLEKTLICEACEQDGVEKTAIAFCVDCQDYLCADCSRHHCLPRPMKNHKILSHQEMPQRKASTSLSENCTKHEGESIRFYCKSHKYVGCHTCIATIHRTCINVSTLADLTKNIKQSQLNCQTKRELKEIENMFKTQKLRIIEKDQLSTQCCKAALEEVIRRRKEINKQFDKMEREINAESEKVRIENAVKMKHLTDSCTAKLDSVEKIKSDLQLLEETKQEKQLFIALTKAGVLIGQMKSELLKIKADTKVRQVKLLSNTISDSLVVREDSLGLLQVYDEQNDEQAKSDDTYEQTGSCKFFKMSPTRFVSTDYQRCQAFLFDKNVSKIQDVKFATGPWDMTKTGKDMVAVTFPHEKKIKFLYISNSIQEVGQILAHGYCKGIASVDNKLVVTFSDPAGLKILNEFGVLKNFQFNTQFKHLREPAYVAADENMNIFVTDPSTNTVAKLTINGRVEKVCKSIKMPLHICICGENVIVSEGKSATAHILNYDFTKHETVSTFQDIPTSGVMSISPAGVMFQVVLLLEDDDFRLPGELPNVTFVKQGQDTADIHASTGTANNRVILDKKCTIS